MTAKQRMRIAYLEREIELAKESTDGNNNLFIDNAEIELEDIRHSAAADEACDAAEIAADEAIAHQADGRIY